MSTDILKATAVAPSNIAFIKYWGRKDEQLKLPLNGSISMNLSNMTTTTTVEFNKSFVSDEVNIDKIESKLAKDKVISHLDRIRQIAKVDIKAKVVSKNNFPDSTGLSSSSSAFASLTLASSRSLGLSLSQKELSVLSRFGSGSSCRSIPDGFVEWLEGEDSQSSYAYSIFPPDYFDIADMVVVVSIEKKVTSSTQGQSLVRTSPFINTRLENINGKITSIKRFIKEKDFTLFGQLLESEALEMHAIMLTSSPSLIYIQPQTIIIIKLIKELRSKGFEVYFTLNTGQNIHIICKSQDVGKLKSLLTGRKEVSEIIINYPCIGARLTDSHQF